MAQNVTLRDIVVGEKAVTDPDFTPTSVIRPRKVYNSALPNLAVGEGMRITFEKDSGAGFVVLGTATYYPEAPIDPTKIVQPVLTFDFVEMNPGTGE